MSPDHSEERVFEVQTLPSCNASPVPILIALDWQQEFDIVQSALASHETEVDGAVAELTQDQV